MKRVLWLALAALTVVGGMPVAAQTLQSGDPGFGWQWVRSHPFSIQADSQNSETWDIDEYFGAGMTLLNWDRGNPYTILNLPPQYADAPWQAWTGFRSVESAIGTYNILRTRPNNVGWIIGDEPKRLDMPDYATVSAYIRQTDPTNGSQLVYSNVGPGGGTASDYYGDGSNPGYTYSQYLDDFISIIQPDVLQYDQYPFYADGSTWDIYFDTLMTVRAKAQASNLPYWAWMQAWGVNQNRYPSESDNRFNVYTHLTAGYTGLSYWTYDHYYSTMTGLIDVNGTPTALYYTAAQTNGEAVKLGESLRFLNSTDVRFVPGSHDIGGGSPGINSTPTGLTNWSAGAGGDPHIQSLVVDPNQAGYLGLDKNGLVGLFTDDADEHYFMLTNLDHGQNLSAAATTLSFTLTFDSGVNSIWRLDRVTGLSVEVPLTNNVLDWTLPGGTGDLFKYDNGNFAGVALSALGDSNAVPEPSSLMLLAMGWLLATKRVRPLR